MKVINKFREETGYTLTKTDSEYYYEGSLYLKGTAITSLPDNLTVGGSLNLEGTAITSLPDNLTVGGSLDLEGTAITSLPDNLTVGGYLDLRGTAITSLPDNLTVGGSLDLRGTAITSLPDNLTVGGSLDLEGTAITSLPDNLTVGGYLDLEGTAITSLPDNLTVGGSLYLECTAITDASKVNRNAPDIYTWRNRKYIKSDGIFSEIVSNRGNVYRIKQIGSNDIRYLITDGNKWSHGDSLKEAKEDLIYKISNRDKSDYENLNLDSELTFEEAVEMYRVITGACSFGTKDFVKNRLKDKKDKYTISEIIELTKEEYGGNTLYHSLKNKLMDITSQTKAIKEHLMKGNGITSLGALHLYGCLRLSGRIHDLRNKHGLPIRTDMIEVNGKRVAKYTLERN